MKRHTLVGIALSTLTLLLAVEAAQAQYGRGRGYGGYGNSGYGNNSYGSNWYGNGYNNSSWGYGQHYGYGGLGYGNYNQGNYNQGNWGYRNPYNYGWGSNYNSNPYYSSGAAYSAPVYSGTPYNSPIVSGNFAYDTTQPPTSGGYQSFYSAPTVSANQVLLRIYVPTPDAQVWIQGQATQQTGLERYFMSPALEPGTYTYTLRGTWTESGREVSREKQVSVRPGQESVVRFTDADSAPATTSTTTSTTTTTTTTPATSVPPDASGTIRNPLNPSGTNTTPGAIKPTDDIKPSPKDND